MVGSKPAPTVMQPGTVDPILMQGGQPGVQRGQFSYPRGIAVDSHGDIYVADSRNHRIQKIDGKTGKYLLDFGGLFKVDGGDPKKVTGTAPGKMQEPNDVAIGPDDMVYVMDTWNGRIQIFSPKGKIKKVFTTDDGFFAPRGIVVDPNGSLFTWPTRESTGSSKIRPQGKQGSGLGFQWREARRV